MLDFKDLRILVVGDVCLNIVEEGESNRIAAEAPVPVILNPNINYELGMAGGVAVNLKNLGVDVYINGFAGKKDSFHTNKILSILDNYEIKYKAIGINVNKKADTIIKKRVFANNQQIARIDKENFSGTDDLWLKGLENTFDKYDTDFFDYIIISDYNKGFINKSSWSFMKPILEKYNKSDQFFVDTKKKDILNYYEGMHIFPNRKEMEELLTYNNCKNRNELRQEMDLEFIIETASQEGAFIYKDDGKIIHCPTFPINSDYINTYGAGDVFIAAFSLYYHKTNKKRKSLEFANYCCSKAVTKKGICKINLNEVMDFEA